MDYNDNIIKAVDIIRELESTRDNISLSSPVHGIDFETIILLINDLYGSEVGLKDVQNAITIRDLIAYWDDSLVATLNGAIDIIQRCTENNRIAMLYNTIEYLKLDINKAIPLLNDYYRAEITFDDVKNSTIVRELLSYWDESLTYPYIEGIRILKQCSDAEQIRLYNSLSFIHLDVEKSTRLLNEYYSVQINYKTIKESSSVKTYLSYWDDYLKSHYFNALEIVQRCSDTNTKVRLSSKLGTIKLNVPDCVLLLNALTFSQSAYDEVDDSTTVEELLALWEKKKKERIRRQLLPKNNDDNDYNDNSNENDDGPHNPLNWVWYIIGCCCLLYMVFPNSTFLGKIVDFYASNHTDIKWIDNIIRFFNPESWGNLLIEGSFNVINNDTTSEVSANAGGDHSTFRLILLIVLIVITLLVLLILLSLGNKDDDEINKERVSKHLLLSSFLTTVLLVCTHCLTFNTLNRVFFIRLIVLFWMVYGLGYLEASILLRFNKFKLNYTNILLIQFSLAIVNFGLFYLISR